MSNGNAFVSGGVRFKSRASQTLVYSYNYAAEQTIKPNAKEKNFNKFTIIKGASSTSIILFSSIATTHFQKASLWKWIGLQPLY